MKELKEKAQEWIDQLNDIKNDIWHELKYQEDKSPHENSVIAADTLIDEAISEL